MIVRHLFVFVAIIFRQINHFGHFCHCLAAVFATELNAPCVLVVRIVITVACPLRHNGLIRLMMMRATGGRWRTIRSISARWRVLALHWAWWLSTGIGPWTMCCRRKKFQDYTIVCKSTLLPSHNKAKIKWLTHTIIDVSTFAFTWIANTFC